MNLIALMTACVAALHVEVALAPDQPLPHVYMGDPVILELKSDTDQTVGVICEIERDTGNPIIMDLGRVELRAHSVYWRPIEGLPDIRGRYRATIRLSSDNVVQEETHVFARIDRPVDGLSLPVGINVNGTDRQALGALPIVSVRYVRLDAMAPNVEELIDAAIRADLVVTPVFRSPTRPEASDQLIRLLEDYEVYIMRFDVSAGSGLERIQEMAETLQAAGSPIPMALVVDSPEEFASLLRQGVGRYISLAVINENEVAGQEGAAFRRTAERAGYERMPLHIVHNSAQSSAEEPSTLIQALVLNTAEQIEKTNLDASTVFANGSFGMGYVPLGGFARRLHEADYVGDFPVADQHQAHVFRTSEGWCVVAWSENGDPEIPLRIGAAEQLRLGDASNNRLDPPEGDEDGTFIVPVGEQPVYLSGSGGDVLVTAAQRMARREAQSMLDNDTLRDDLPSDLIDILTRITANNGESLERHDFFTLVRHFPYLEREWHTGGMNRSSAVVAMAALARLVRHLGVIEEYHGEAFIEPFQETLDRCSQYQSLYLTRSGGANGSQERADWILKEVGRLMAEAEHLMVKGRSIEANAVATMAEWRARSLEFAATAAPLSQPEPAPPEEIEPEAEEEDEPEAAESEAEYIEIDEGEEPEVEEAEPEEEGPQELVFEVEPGEGPWAIAQKHGVDLDDLRRWNNWGRNPTLRIGQEYIIYQ